MGYPEPIAALHALCRVPRSADGEPSQRERSRRSSLRGRRRPCVSSARRPPPRRAGCELRLAWVSDRFFHLRTTTSSPLRRSPMPCRSRREQTSQRRESRTSPATPARRSRSSGTPRRRPPAGLSTSTCASSYNARLPVYRATALASRARRANRDSAGYGDGSTRSSRSGATGPVTPCIPARPARSRGRLPPRERGSSSRHRPFARRGPPGRGRRQSVASALARRDAGRPQRGRR
jgi:hypothetical protein